jgi:hypothetical protein
MRRIRLSALMLLVVIAALSTALVVQHRRAARREAELKLKAKLSAAGFDIFVNENNESVLKTVNAIIKN